MMIPAVCAALTIGVPCIMGLCYAAGHFRGERSGKKEALRRCEAAGAGKFTVKGGEIGFEFNIPRY
jgi:hypothetical protein